MSEFSGKCDFADHVEIFGVENVLKSEVFVGNKKLNPKCYADLIPYFPHLVSCFVKNGTNTTVKLTEKSYVDYQEADMLRSYLNSILREYDKCRREKKEFDAEKAAQEVSFYKHNIEAIRELAERVAMNGRKAEIDDIHLSVSEHYRKRLIEEMIKNRVDPARWGYGRLCEEGVSFEDY